MGAQEDEMKKVTLVVLGDGVTDDTEALQAYLDGKANLIYPDGRPFLYGSGGKFKTSKALTVSSNTSNSQVKITTEEEIDELKLQVSILRKAIEGYFYDVCNYQPMKEALDKTRAQGELK
jgi:hypothetical protein